MSLCYPKNLIEKLRQAILDERKTAELYRCLSEISESFQGVDAFAEARRDELDHAAALTRVVERLTCRTPKEATQPVRAPVFYSYCNGVKMAISGERDAIQEYTELIKLSRSRELDRILEEIRADEEVHLAKFRKLYDIECMFAHMPAATPDPCLGTYW